MNGNLLISIVMPAYNSEKYIEESIMSVLKQTYKNFELIVIDDYSSDSTPLIINRLSLIDTRITYYHNEQNSGVSFTRNRGVRLANGKWIAFIDSDDIWCVNKLEKQVMCLNTCKDASLIFTGSTFVSSNGKAISYNLKVPHMITYRQLLKQNIISCSSVLVKKSLLVKYQMQLDSMHEDYAVWLQILKAGYIAYGINEPLLIYRISPNSKSGNKLKASIMTLKVYRFLKLNFFQQIYYMFFYAIKSLNKYRQIKNKKE